MKKYVVFFSLLSVLVLLNGCQKEVSKETGKDSSTGSLQSNVTGDCLPKTVSGIYEKGTALDPTTNHIDVQIDVVKAGAYLVYTDTVNGMSFKTSGIFTSTGMTTVTLKGNGTPLNDGIINFIVTYDSTECVVPVTVLPTGGAVPATFTISGAPNVCMNYALNGDYVMGTAMTAGNTVVINVNVTVAGTYSVTTPTSNGIIFSGTGTLAVGAQTITLVAGGTPVAAGNTNIPVTAGSSSCSFTLTTLATAAPRDYYPRVANDNWSYDWNNVTNDSILRLVIAPTHNAFGSEFNIFAATTDATLGFDSAGYYRKAGGDYYEFVDIGDLYGLNEHIWIQYIFLKDNVAQGVSWQSADYSGTITDPSTSQTAPITFRLNYKIGQKDVAVSVHGTSYANVIVVEERADVKVGTVYQDATSDIGYYKSYYAPNIGIIKQEYINPNGSAGDVLAMRRYQVF